MAGKAGFKWWVREPHPGRQKNNQPRTEQPMVLCFSA
jgi:hypothetical protein